MSVGNSNILNVEAKILKSAVCKVNTFLRPYPSLFYYPGLRSHPIWSKDVLKNNPNKNYSDILDMLNKLEENYNNLSNEFNDSCVKNKNNLLNNYNLINNEHKLHQGEWIWYNYITRGKRENEFKNNFPFTSKLLDSFKGILIENIPFSYSFYSLLKDKTEISHHYGPCNIRLRIHLGIDIPENCKNHDSSCKIEICGQDYFWENGKTIMFDDTYIHSVINKSGKTRVILLLDVWHPDLHEHEKHAIINILEKGQSMINTKL